MGVTIPILAGAKGSLTRKLGLDSWLPSAIGGLFGASSAKDAAREAMEFEANQARINREWQERMSNTSHQREVADLRAAGLNPILSATRGATTPGGAQGRGFQATTAQSAAATAKATQSGQLVRNQNTLLQSQSSAQDATAKNQYSQSMLANQNAQNAGITEAILKEQLHQQQNNSRLSDLSLVVPEFFGGWVNSALSGDAVMREITSLIPRLPRPSGNKGSSNTRPINLPNGRGSATPQERYRYNLPQRGRK